MRGFLFFVGVGGVGVGVRQADKRGQSLGVRFLLGVHTEMVFLRDFEL